MFKILHLTFALIGGLALALFAARLVGGTQPSSLAPLFTNPDGTPCERPCLFGIQPGKTTRDGAIALLKAHHLVVSEAKYTTKDGAEIMLTARSDKFLEGQSFSIYIQGFSDISAVTIYRGMLPDPKAATIANLPALAPIGDVITLFGMPDSFLRASYQGLWYYFLNQRGVIAHTDGGEDVYAGGGWFVPRAPTDKVVSLAVFESDLTKASGFKWCGFSMRPHPIESRCSAIRP